GSVVGAVKTNVPGIEIGGVFPKMANHADNLAFIRSFAHRNSGHGGGTHFVMTGYDFPPADNGQAPIKPGLGSILSRHRGANNPATGLPTYVRLSGILGDGPAWLGSPYAPFDVGGQAQQNMAPKVALDPLCAPRPPPRPPLAPEDLRQDRAQGGPQRRHAGPGQFRDAGLRPGAEPGARGLRREPRGAAAARPLRHRPGAADAAGPAAVRGGRR